MKSSTFFRLMAGVFLSCASAVVAYGGVVRVFELPKFIHPPVLDGIRSPGEWDGALELECSPSQVLRDGAEFGWRDIEQQASEVSVNQLVQSEWEDSAEARTDADYASVIWQAWDDDALYYLIEVRDNFRDTEGGGEWANWWERDSISLYLDLNNEDHPGGNPTGEYVNLNVLNFMAVPQNSSEQSVTMWTTVQNQFDTAQDPEELAGFEYGFRDAGDEFGGEADYVIEGKMPWDTYLRTGNLYEKPTVGSEMGFTWLGLDPDGDDAYGGQIQCVARADGNMSEFANWVFVDTPVGITENAPSLSMPALKGREGDTVIIPVNLEKANLVAGGDLTITYDPDVLAFQEVKKGELLPSGAFVVVSNMPAPGRISISIAGSQTIGQQDGKLLELVFEASEFRIDQDNRTDLTFSVGSLSDVSGNLIGAFRENGSFVLQLGLPGDVNQDENISSADAIIVLRAVVGLATLDATQQVLADVNEDGRINAGDAVLILRKAVGLIAKMVVLSGSPATVAWGLPERTQEGQIVVPLLLGEEIHGGAFVVEYNAEAWQPVRVQTEREGLVALNDDRVGELRFNVASPSSLGCVELVLTPVGKGLDGVLVSLNDVSVVDGYGRSLEAVIPSLDASWSSNVSVLPQSYQLLPPYPNPFNPETHISYLLPQREEVTLEVYALTGQRVRTLESGEVLAGMHRQVWNGLDNAGRRVSSGVYLLRWQAGSFVQTRRVVLIR